MTVQLKFTCPRCEYAVDSATGIGPDGETLTAHPGDISLCLFCGAPLEFQDGAPPRWLTYGELVKASEDSSEGRARIVQAILYIVTMRPSHVRARVNTGHQ